MILVTQPHRASYRALNFQVFGQPFVGPLRTGEGDAAPEPEPEVEVTSGGVWLEGLRRRRMAQLQREAEEAKSRRQWRQLRRAKKRRGALRELQETLAAAAEIDLSDEQGRRISKAVKPFTVRTYDGTLVPVSALDWQRLLDDSAAVANLAREMLRIADALEEEDAAFAMMMMH